MRMVSDNEYTPAVIKSELERLYLAANYLNADGSDLDLVIDLIAAAIQDLDSMVPQHSTLRNLRLIHDSDEESRGSGQNRT